MEARVEGMKTGATLASQLIGGTPGGIWDCSLVARVSSPAGSYEALTAHFMKMDNHSVEHLSPSDLRDALKQLRLMDEEIIRNGFEPQPSGPYWYSRRYRRPYDPDSRVSVSVDDLLREGAQLRAAGRTREAIDLYTEVLSIDSGCREAYLRRADSLRVAGELQRALQDCQGIFPLNDGQGEIAESLLVRALIYEGLEDFPAAMNDCRIIKQRHLSRYGRARVSEIIGHCKLEVEDLRGAEASYSQAIKLDPDDSRVRLNRSEVYMRRGKFTEAIRDCRYVLERNPEDDRAQGALRRAEKKAHR
ncbi:tetratricopeptide repeat protein [Streptomyces sp. NPDC058049]|uniref:tetratricopeptide repeat protein n=1 Tax=Streptomyces sp. NPDC058049 TaxID=3346314 RepID=UPI0036E41D23